MAEPNTSSISVTAVLIGLMGPLAGQYSLIVMAALAGALWPLSTMGTTTKRAGAFFLLRVVFTAIFLTGSCAWFLSDQFQVPVYEGMAVVAFAIGALGNGWGTVFRGLRDGIAAFLRGFGGGGGSSGNGGFGGGPDDNRYS
jgi:hypothetical protein